MDSTTPLPSDEIDLLDLLVTVAENIKLLVLGPLLVGLAALGYSYTLPATYQSTSLLAIDKQGRTLNANVVATLATSAPVLDAVAQDMGLLAQGLSADQARQQLKGQVKASLGGADNLLSITTTAAQPQQAQRLNQLVLQHLYAQTRPRGDERTRLQQRLEHEQASYATSSQLEQTLARQLAAGRGNDQTSDTYATLIFSNTSRFASIQSLQAQLLGLESDDLVQPATLPERGIGNQKGKKAVIAALASGFVLLLWVFVRQAVRNAAAQAVSANKLVRIRQALGLR